MRSKFPYKKIPFIEISKIEIKKSFGTKYPFRLSIFGFIFILIPVWAFLSGWIDLMPPDLVGSKAYSAWRGYGALIVIVGFMLTIGLLSFSQVLIRKTILRVEFMDGTDELLPLDKISKPKSLTSLINFLISVFPPTIFRFDNRTVKSD